MDTGRIDDAGQGDDMIPTMLITGVIAGLFPARWALVVVVLLGIGWSALLLAGGVESSVDGAILAALLVFGNAAVGASVSQSVKLGIRYVASAR